MKTGGQPVLLNRGISQACTPPPYIRLSASFSFSQANKNSTSGASVHPAGFDSEMKNDLRIQRNVWRNPPGIGEENMGSGGLFPLFLFLSPTLTPGLVLIGQIFSETSTQMFFSCSSTVLLLMKFLLLRGYSLIDRCPGYHLIFQFMTFHC